MRFPALIFGVLATALALPASAQTVDVNLSDDVVEAHLKNPLNLGGGPNRAHYQVGFLYKDDKRNTTMGDLGFEVTGPVAPNAPGFTVGAGINGYLASVADYDVGAITLGLMGRYDFAAFERVSITARINFAPDITTFNDGEDFLYTTARLGYEILSDVEIYMGYRDINVSLDNGRDLGVDQSWMVGLEMKLN